jgi:hypothetical protein
MGMQEMYKIMEPVVKDKYLFITNELGHHLPVIQLACGLFGMDSGKGRGSQARVVVIRQGS